MNKILAKEQYLIIKHQWNNNARGHSASMHLMYNLLRSYAPDRGFCAITSTRKLNAHNNDAWLSYMLQRYRSSYVLWTWL